MGQLTIGTVANGVSREKLFEWYTDFSSEDVDIMKRRSNGNLLSRVVTRNGNKIHWEQDVRTGMGKPMHMIVDAVLHPEDFSYDAHIWSPMLESDRHYTFTQLQEGTRISFDDNYRLASGWLKVFNVLLLGQFKRLYAWGGKSVMRAYIAEAEEQLANKESKQNS